MRVPHLCLRLCLCLCISLGISFSYGCSTNKTNPIQAIGNPSLVNSRERNARGALIQGTVCCLKPFLCEGALLLGYLALVCMLQNMFCTES